MYIQQIGNYKLWKIKYSKGSVCVTRLKYLNFVKTIYAQIYMYDNVWPTRCES